MSNDLVPTVPGATVQEQPSPISKAAMMQQIGSGLKLTDEQRRKLVVDAGDNLLNLKPTGEIYVPGVHWRTILNQVFDPFGWGVVGGAPQLDLHERGNSSGDQGKSTMYRDVFLRISRCDRCWKSINVCQCGGPYTFYTAAQAIGAQEYHPTNSRLAMDDAAEGALTNGLMRCCKVFGIYDNVWNPIFAEAAKHRIGVRVKVQWSSGTVKYYWRLLDSQPLADEVGVADDSPNKDAYLQRFPPKGRQHQQDTDRPPQGRPIPRGQTPARAAKEKPADPKPEPPVEGEDQTPQKILVIRAVPYDGGTYWVLNLDPAGEFIIEDEQVVKSLENAKARGKRVIITTTDNLRTKSGTRKKLIEFRLT